MTSNSHSSTRRRVLSQPRLETLEDRCVPTGVIFTENFTFDDPNNPPSFMSDQAGFDTGLDGFHLRSTIGGDSGLTFMPALLPPLGIPLPDANEASPPWALALQKEPEAEGGRVGSYTATIPGVGEPDGLFAGEEIAFAKVSIRGNGLVTFVGVPGQSSTVEVFAVQGWQFVSRGSSFQIQEGVRLGGITEIRVETTSPNPLIVDDVTVLIGTEQGTGEGVARDDGYVVPPGEAIVMDVLFNDIAPTLNRYVGAINGESQESTRTTHGTVIRSPIGNELIYVSDPDFHGIDTFEYVMEWFGGSHSGSDTGRVIVTVNNVPVARPAAYSPDPPPGHEQHHKTHGPLSGSFVFEDADGDALSFEVIGPPTHGRLDLTRDGNTVNFVYHVLHPDNRLRNADQFVYRVDDGLSTSDGVVRIEIVNSEPTVHDHVSIDRGSFSLLTPTGSQVVRGNVLFGFHGATADDAFDLDGDLLTAVKAFDPEHGSVVIDPDGMFIYTPFPEAEHRIFGTDTFGYQATDGYLSSAVATVTIKQTFGQGFTRSDAFTIHWDADEPDKILYIDPEDLLANDGFKDVVPTGLTAIPYYSYVRILGFADEAFYRGRFFIYDVDSDLVTRVTPAPDGGAPGRPDLLLRRGEYLAFIANDDQSDFRTNLVYDFLYPEPGFPLNAGPPDVNNTSHYSTVFINVTQHPHGDTDGVDDFVELLARDGNGDGILDHAQNNVAALPNSQDGRYLTLASEPGTALLDVSAVPNPSPADAPAAFPLGFFDFRLAGISFLEERTVTLYLPPGVSVNTYYKYGVVRDDPTTHLLESALPPHWYEFLYDPNSAPGDPDFRTGAETHAQNPAIPANQIVLHFRDSWRGDNDRLENAIISDPGGPAFRLPPTVASVALNDGAAQRSRINRLTVTFSGVVTLDRGAFKLQRAGGGSINLIVTSSVVNGQTVATLTFRGPVASLADGNYQLRLLPAKVRDLLGRVLDGDADGVAGGNFSYRFHRRFGDHDGDGDVDRFDLQGFFQTRTQGADAWWLFDYDADGRLTARDQRQLFVRLPGQYRNGQ